MNCCHRGYEPPFLNVQLLIRFAKDGFSVGWFAGEDAGALLFFLFQWYAPRRYLQRFENTVDFWFVDKMAHSKSTMDLGFVGIFGGEVSFEFIQRIDIACVFLSQF